MLKMWKRELFLENVSFQGYSFGFNKMKREFSTMGAFPNVWTRYLAQWKSSASSLFHRCLALGC